MTQAVGKVAMTVSKNVTLYHLHAEPFGNVSQNFQIYAHRFMCKNVYYKTIGKMKASGMFLNTV